MQILRRKKVFVAMSGGVDSSVAALLLKNQGYAVTGVYMKNWSEESFRGKSTFHCPWREELREVQQVCKVLRIPMKVYNFEREYRRDVIDYFFERERRGDTPNPDVLCNREIKFGLFLDKALAEGAEYIATGHYAKARSRKGKYELVQARDQNKDQTYFLCLLSQKQLKSTLFPLGGLLKSEVRALARANSLPNAERAESMGICFIGEMKFLDFLKSEIKENQGKIVDSQGKILGQHRGLPFYTIGQRQGLELGGGLPYYVVAKNRLKNQLIVARGSNAPELFATKLQARSWHWIKAVPHSPLVCQVRIRHRQKLESAKLVKFRGKYQVIFHRRQRGITPGQFCVLYRNKIVLGGGEIARSLA